MEKQNIYKVKLGKIKIKGSYEEIIKTMYTHYGRSLRDIQRVIGGITPEGLRQKIKKLGYKKYNAILADEEVFKLTDAEIVEKYDYTLASVKRARKRVGMEKRLVCCQNGVSISRRRKRIVKRLFSSYFKPGENFVDEFTNIVTSMNISEKNKNILINFYINGLPILKSKRVYKTKLIKILQKEIQKKHINWYINKKLIKEIK